MQTLTTGIFSVWLQGSNVGGAAQIACVILALILALVALEKVGRRRIRFYRLSRQRRPMQPVPLAGWRAWLAAALCALPVLAGFVLPVAVLGGHAMARPALWADPGLVAALVNSVTVGFAAAVVTVAAGLFMVYGVRIGGHRLPACCCR